MDDCARDCRFDGTETDNVIEAIVMINPSPKRTRFFPGILRDLFVLVFAELIVVALAWCTSPTGKILLARLFRSKRSARTGSNTAAPIDV